MDLKMNGVGCGSFLDPSDVRSNRIVLWPDLVTAGHLWESSKYPVTETHGLDRGKHGQRTKPSGKSNRGYSRLSPKAFKPWRKYVTVKVTKKKKKGRKHG